MEFEGEVRDGIRDAEEMSFPTGLKDSHRESGGDVFG